LSAPKITPAKWNLYFEFLMKWEGEVLENVPGDAGGLTKFGIDQRAHPGVDIAALTRDDAKRVHLQDYFQTDAARLPEPFNYAFFDMAMNAGNRAAVKTLQRAVGSSEIDGAYGPKTQRDVDNYFRRVTPAEFMLRYHTEREAYYRRLAWGSAKLARFLNGWLNRTMSSKKWCIARLREEGAA